MTWSYDITALTTTPLYALRLLIGDTIVKDPQLQDEELTWFISQRTSVYGAAAEACRSLSSQMSRQADSTQGKLHTLYSARSRAYAAAAARFEVLAIARSAALPYSGQTSYADYAQNAINPDRMGPQFAIGMDDNYLPDGIVGPENTSGPGGYGYADGEE